MYAMRNVKTDCLPLLFHSWKNRAFSVGKMAMQASIPTNGIAVVSAQGGTHQFGSFPLLSAKRSTLEDSNASLSTTRT